MQKLHNLTGKRFNYVVALEFSGWRVHPAGNRTAMWKFRCDCGKVFLAQAGNYRSGQSKSCGCKKAEFNSKAHIKHGHWVGGRPSRLLAVWTGMKLRCNTPSCTGYEHYGGRGIKVLWESFEKFVEDMGDSWVDGLTIERIDNDGHYCKDNCKWSTASEQALNRRPRKASNG
jgi:hypothetical protein